MLENITYYTVAPLGSQVREGVCEGGSLCKAVYTYMGETAPALRSQNISANEKRNIMVSIPQRGSSYPVIQEQHPVRN